MHKLLIPVALSLALACGTDQATTQAPATETADSSFAKYSRYFVEDLFELYPSWATWSGYEGYDSILVIPDEKFRTKERGFIDRHLDSVNRYSSLSLSPSALTDLALIKNQLESSRWYANEFREYSWNPSDYNVAGSFAAVLSSGKKTLNDKVRDLHKKLLRVPAYYQQAKLNLHKPTREHTELAITQSKGAQGYLNTALRDSIQAALKGEELSKATAALDAAVDAIGGYISWLETDALPAATKDFRIGKDAFTQKFAYDIQSARSAEEVYQLALQTKSELHREMARLSRELWPKYMGNKSMPADSIELIRQVIDHLSVKHVHRDSFLTAIEAQIPQLERFVREKDLLYLDPAKPLIVRETPAYMAGVAGASISAPGPFDPEGNTYYNVTPLTGYSKEEAESYLREYNHYILQILNIHEAIPGHYAQLVYANQSPSLIKSLLGNGTMIEGWAVYTERMMMEEGYDDSPEMWLMFNKWHLRAVANTILDYGIHANGMTRDEAMDLMVRQAFQQKAEAEKKWVRATLSQVQLSSYFTGYSEIYRLREDIKKKQGDAFDLKKFHEQFLSYGSAPVKEIRKLMLGE